MTTKIIPRKGARTLASMDPSILALLESGTLETANLTEGLAIRMDRLMQSSAPKVPKNTIDMNAGVVVRMAQAGAALRNAYTAKALRDFQNHTSDTVRGWTAFAIGQNEKLQPQERLEKIKPFAADPHFGVREWAWMAVRAIIVADPLNSIATLAPWVKSADANIRRFASEATRPRGVWAAAIPLLRKEPDHALPILIPLRHDTMRYVEDSVANWINDAAKDNPAWVKALLKKWQADKVAPRLIARAGRSLK
jgi:3-methyladenine DNA glycosylase AlkC